MLWHVCLSDREQTRKNIMATVLRPENWDQVPAKIQPGTHCRIIIPPYAGKNFVLTGIRQSNNAIEFYGQLVGTREVLLFGTIDTLMSNGEIQNTVIGGVVLKWRDPEKGSGTLVTHPKK